MTTNYERIKNMTVEEMANMLEDHTIYRCLHCSYHYETKDKSCEATSICRIGFKLWLQSECEV